MKIKFLITTDQIEKYPVEADKLLEILGHEEALITDMSTFGDFILNETPEEDQMALWNVSKALGFQVKLSDTLVSACERMRQKKSK
jgi:hypothetical protein